jgi:hypothetical protein
MYMNYTEGALAVSGRLLVTRVQIQFQSSYE